mgnify:CR=1 FL=1
MFYLELRGLTRSAIAEAYKVHGVRTFSLDTHDELAKIVEATDAALNQARFEFVSAEAARFAEAFPEEIPDWRPSLNYSLARVHEAQRNLDDAILIYRQDDSPQRPGNLLRARWLEKLNK